jgi:predicted dehydrogenase
MHKKIKMGMVGGGLGAFIGDVHRKAAALDGMIEFVCGAFSSNAEKSKKSGEALGIPADRVYANYEEMIMAEKALPADERMDFISIVTPNHVHFGPAKMALENGFHVVCDKPLCFDMEEAYTLEKLVEETGLIFALTHNYTGYPMIKQAKHMVASGQIGKVRKVLVEYIQGWLATNLEASDQKQAAWRTDPKKSGVAGCMGDIGSHAENLVEYVTGLSISEMSADLNIFVEGRQLDDDGNVLLRFDNGARGVLTSSQIAVGEENCLRLRIYGETGGLAWAQEEPNSLVVTHLEKPREIYRTGVGALCDAATAHTRIPAGHPEGYLEAFANIYRNFSKCVLAKKNGEEVDSVYQDFPGVKEGVRGMHFINKVVESSNSDVKWLKV